jgi:phosphatidylglycerophosphate synthase
VPEGPHTPGEAWARDQLCDLLAAGFSARGVDAFLRASAGRSAEIRAARPELAGQARAWLAGGALLWLGLAAAGVPPFRRAAPAGLAWWAATSLMLDWHLGMVETEDGRPRPLGPADALTLARAWLVPVVFAAPGPLVCAAGAATDVLEGVAARRREPTRAGRDLEGLVDGCFTAAAIGGLRRAGRIGRGPARAELLRLGCGGAYAAFRYFARAEPPDRELVRAARASTAMRAGGLVVAATGRRRLGDGLVAAGCAFSLGLLVRTAAAR